MGSEIVPLIHLTACVAEVTTSFKNRSLSTRVTCGAASMHGVAHAGSLLGVSHVSSQMAGTRRRPSQALRASTHASAIRSSGERSATSKTFSRGGGGLKRFLAPPAHKATWGDNTNNALEDDFFHLEDSPSHILSIHPHGAYPSFALNDATFCAAVLLLGTSRCASQIPQTLPWVHALGVPPLVRTLAYALVFWTR
jgi:hypothetical protein